jgi:hypothetical protein
MGPDLTTTMPITLRKSTKQFNVDGTMNKNYFCTRIVVLLREVAVNSFHVAFPHDGIESTFDVSDFSEVGTGRGHLTNVHNGARSLCLI